MFRIDTQTNRIAPLAVKSFTELGFSERRHLQEWIAHEPQMLGEELLIIQKEFDGFDDTRERLDLLALDKDGNLVIIENKLDDSGRDMVWQALKYAGYCSNLSKSQIVEIYQRFLNQESSESNTEGNAAETIVEFLEAGDLDEVILNSGQSQRIMFVAANYRKEVTNTALWLIGHGIPCQCFKVTPYVSAADLFLNVEQIIPTPESKEFMIGMAAKEAEEKSTDNELKKRHCLRLEFWEQALEVLKPSPCDLYNNVSPGKDHWLSAGSGIGGMTYALIFGKKMIRVELSMAHNQAEKNTFVFDALLSQKEAIENQFGAELVWLPLPEKKACRVQFEKVVDGYDKSNWPEMITWLVEHIAKLERAFKKPLADLNQKLKTELFNVAKGEYLQ